MIDFWLWVGLLLLVALSFVLIPVLFVRRAQSEEDRTAFYVALYQERLAELQLQQGDGVMSPAQKNSARSGADRELLADTEGAGLERFSTTGKPLPVFVAFLIPALGLALYLHFGASDKVELVREFAQPPGSLAQMNDRLERAVNAQPESAENAYNLAQNYMAQGRPDDAARMFERTVSLAGRRPELLGEWAKALYFSNNKMWSPPIKALTDEALNGNPGELQSLSLIGLAAFEEHRYQDALKYWHHALAEMGSDHPSHAALVQAIGKARNGLSADEKNNNLTINHVAGLPPTPLKVRVDISPEIFEKVALDDSVFVFVQTLSGSKVPLATIRLKVSSLPAEVEFSGADAIVTSNTLSQTAAIQVTARVSRGGKSRSGEWLGRSSTTLNSKSARLKLTINLPDI